MVGVLSALKTGLETFNEKACIIMMVDGSDDPSTINKMSKIYESGYDLVCASRYVNGGRHIGGPLLKKFKLLCRQKFILSNYTSN